MTLEAPVLLDLMEVVHRRRLLHVMPLGRLAFVKATELG